MRTVLQIAQDALFDTGLTPPTSLESATDFVQNQIKAILYNEARALRRMRNWKTQKRIHTFTTTADRDAYPLPEDFYSMVGDTAYDRSASLRLQNSISDPRWNDRLYGYQLVGSPYGYRVFGPDINPSTDGGQFKLNPPAASTGITIGFEYRTANLFLPPNWTEGESIGSTGIYRNANGNIYVSASTGTCGSDIPSHTTGTVDDGTVDWTYVTAPYETIRSDEDLSIFDDEVLVLGLMWRWKKSKGQDFSQERLDWEEAKRTAPSRWHGAYRGKLSRVSRQQRRYTAPDGGWSF